LFLEGFEERSKIKVALEIPNSFERLPQELETAIFRIVQECLTNIHRHSGSRVAAIRVAREGNEVRLEVRDQGKGMPSSPNGARIERWASVFRACARELRNSMVASRFVPARKELR
jgi:signal transduction histidine kinase